MWIVDQALPPNRGTGLLKVGAHDDEQPVAQRIGHWFQSVGVLIGRLRIMDRTGSYNHQEAFTVLAVQNTANGISGFNDQLGGLVGHRQC